ncbi:hypothetical protein Ddye_009956, partial [Dipteronia dyeriana]
MAGSSASFDKRKGRDPSQSIPEWGTRHKLHLEFDSSWDPIGPNQKILKTQLGHIVKNGMIAPLTYLEWSYMPNDLLDHIWKEVKRGWKSRVKKEYYIELGTDEARLPITHSRVIREQWVTLLAKKGKKTDRVSMFIKNRIQIDKDSKKIVIDKNAAQSQFEEHLRHIPEEEQNDIVREHVFTQVMGPDDHGRVRLYGTETSSSNVAQNSTVDEIR